MERFDALFLEDCPELRGGSIALQKILSVFLTKRLHESVAVLFTDFAVLVAMTLVEAWLLHKYLPSKREWCNERGTLFFYIFSHEKSKEGMSLEVISRWQPSSQVPHLPSPVALTQPGGRNWRRVSA
jgi:hypothetical protein